MSKTPNIFVRSLRELKSTRCLAVTALLIAINVTLDLLGLSIKLPPNLRIGFGFLCNASIGMLFGPVVGMMAGVCTDVLGYFAGNLSMGAYFPGYTLTAVVGGLIWGLWLYPRKITVWRAIGGWGMASAQDHRMACHRRKDLHQPVLQYLPEHPVADRHRRQGDERAARYARAEKPYSAADRDRAGLLRHEAGQPYLWRAAEWKDRCGKLLSKGREKPVST